MVLKSIAKHLTKHLSGCTILFYGKMLSIMGQTAWGLHMKKIMHRSLNRSCAWLCVFAVALIFVPTVQANDAAQNSLRNSVVDVVTGQVVGHSAGALEGIGVPAGTADINLTAHGWQRLVDNIDTANKYFIPFATANELQQFTENVGAGRFYFDFVRPADTVNVDFSAGVSNAANLVTGQTTTYDVATPAGRLDTRSDTAFDAARVLRFNTVTLNMERNDCRHPIDMTTGLERTDLPRNICMLHSWQETPSLVLTYRPVITHNGIDINDPARSATATYARDFNSRISGRVWAVSWDAPGGQPVPPVQYPPVGEPCAPTAHNQRAWLPLSTNSSQILTGGAAGAAPNSCQHGVQSATRTWDTEQDAICFDSQYYRQSTTRETNIRWSGVTCNPAPGCSAGFALTAAGTCVSLAGTASVSASNVSGAHFWGFVGGSVQGSEGTARLVCARAGAIKLFDFAGWAYGRKKSGGCGKADSDHVGYQFNGDPNQPASVLNQSNYSVNFSQGSDTNCLGWMQTALCAGYNYLIPTVTAVALNTTNAAAAAPPVGMAACPADLNLAGDAWKSNATYFANAMQGTGFSGSHQTVLASSLAPESYPVTALAKQQLNCYQQTSYQQPVYDYNAPADQWTLVPGTCYDDPYFGSICDPDTSMPPIVGYDTYYSLYTLTTQLNCTEQTVTVPTGVTVNNCNNTGYDGAQYATYTASAGNVCGNDTAPTYSCSPNFPDPCALDPFACFDPGGFGGMYNMF